MFDFVRQSDDPLFPEVFWTRPTMRGRAGRLLIVGGQRSGFNEVHAVYELAEAAGIGECVAAMPDTLLPLIGNDGFARFVPASASGSLGKQALGQLLHLAEDADGTIVGANLTHNAETAVMVESLVRKLDARIIITDETISILKHHPDLFTGNPLALVVCSINGLLTLAANHHMPVAVRPNRGVMGRLEVLRQLSQTSLCSYLVYGEYSMVSAESQVSLTSNTSISDRLPVSAIALASVFWIQNPTKPFAGLTSAAHLLHATSSTANTTVRQTATAVRNRLRELDDQSWQ